MKRNIETQKSHIATFVNRIKALGPLGRPGLELNILISLIYIRNECILRTFLIPHDSNVKIFNTRHC